MVLHVRAKSVPEDAGCQQEFAMALICSYAEHTTCGPLALGARQHHMTHEKPYFLSPLRTSFAVSPDQVLPKSFLHLFA